MNMSSALKEIFKWIDDKSKQSIINKSTGGEINLNLPIIFQPVNPHVTKTL